MNYPQASDPIEYEGTPLEIMNILLAQSIFPEKIQDGEKTAIDQIDSLFVLFEYEFELRSLVEQLAYINEINSSFRENIQYSPKLSNTDRIIRFQLELFRWTGYWRGVIFWKQTRKYPEFGLDLEHMHNFAINYLKGSDRIPYIKNEYERIIKNYKFGTSVLENLKSKLKVLISDYELIVGEKEIHQKANRKYTRLNIESNNSNQSNEEDRSKGSIQTTEVTVNNKEYLTSSDAMNAMCIRKTKLYELNKSKILNPVKFGARKNLYLKSEIELYMKNMQSNMTK